MLRRTIWTAIMQVDCLRKYTGRCPGKEMYKVEIKHMVLDLPKGQRV
jgi:hypothetical protein